MVLGRIAVRTLRLIQQKTAHSGGIVQPIVHPHARDLHQANRWIGINCDKESEGWAIMDTQPLVSLTFDDGRRFAAIA
jgi:hypothetical protein